MAIVLIRPLRYHIIVAVRDGAQRLLRSARQRRREALARKADREVTDEHPERLPWLRRKAL
jgi:hypothetical protein